MVGDCHRVGEKHPKPHICECYGSGRKPFRRLPFDMAPEQGHWLSVVADLGVQVIAPYAVAINGTQVTFTAFFPQFGGPSGMVIDPNWSLIGPHAEALSASGFGYSCVRLDKIDYESMRELLVDWTWNGAAGDKPPWA